MHEYPQMSLFTYSSQQIENHFYEICYSTNTYYKTTCILLPINTTKDFMNYACYECYVSSALQMDNKGISTMAS